MRIGNIVLIALAAAVLAVSATQAGASAFMSAGELADVSGGCSAKCTAKGDPCGLACNIFTSCAGPYCDTDLQHEKCNAGLSTDRCSTYPEPNGCGDMRELGGCMGWFWGTGRCSGGNKIATCHRQRATGSPCQ